MSHAVGRGLHTDEASAAPHICPSSYAQYSSAVHVLPSHPPHPRGSTQAISVQAHIPWSVQPQVLQPSGASFVSPGRHSIGHIAHAHWPGSMQVQLPQPVPVVWPTVHTGGVTVPWHSAIEENCFQSAGAMHGEPYSQHWPVVGSCA